MPAGGAATGIAPRVVIFLALLSLGAGEIASSASAHNSPQHPDRQPTGSARVTGRVVAVDNGAPVRRALVRLSGSPTGSQGTDPKLEYLQREVRTADDGAFSFVGLPAGSYYISVGGTNGFLELARAKRVIVDEGRALDVRVRLERTGAIVGRIADKNGEGLLGVEVLALRRSDFRGHVTVMPAYGSRASTNDLGQFRIFNLSPGDYFVVATPLHAPRDGGTARRSDFVTTYYPGTPALGNARRVIVRAGRDVSNINFTLAAGPLTRVVVDAVDSRGLPLGREASAILDPISEVYLSSSMRQATRPDNAQFVFSDVPRGDYRLIVSTSYRQEEGAYVNVKVDGDVALRVQTNSGATVSGRFVVQGIPRDGSSGRPVSNVVISATRPPDTYGPSYAKEALAHPKGTDTFELTGLRGPMVLHASMSGAVLVSISRQGGEDLVGKSLQFTGTEVIDDLRVVFTHERAEVEVTLTGLREPEDPENVLVMLFSEDPARWHAGSVQYTAIQATAEMSLQRSTARRDIRPAGRVFSFLLGPVVPGRYLVVAVPSPGVMHPTERAILERLRPLAVPVTLVAGETAKVELPVSR